MRASAKTKGTIVLVGSDTANAEAVLWEIAETNRREHHGVQHPVPIFAVGMGDEFGISGTGEACMEHFGLTARGIADRAREALLLKPIVSHPPLFGPVWNNVLRNYS